MSNGFEKHFNLIGVPFWIDSMNMPKFLIESFALQVVFLQLLIVKCVRMQILFKKATQFPAVGVGDQATYQTAQLQEPTNKIN